MCLITFAIDKHPKYRLVIAANRDEFYTRPTRNAQFWTEEGYPDLLAGKDLKAGGTWMAVHTDGRWAALTNYRDPKNLKKDPPSRGSIVLDYLKTDQSVTQYIEQLRPLADRFNGFNLLLGDRIGNFHYSNQTDTLTEVGPGVHGVSNALLDTPWPKLEQAKSDLSRALTYNEVDPEHLFRLLNNTTLAPDEQLPETGIPYEWEKAVSSVFIETEDYGTRCSTLLLIDHDDQIDFYERPFHPHQSKEFETTHYHI